MTIVLATPDRGGADAAAGGPPQHPARAGLARAGDPPVRPWRTDRGDQVHEAGLTRSAVLPRTPSSARRARRLLLEALSAAGQEASHDAGIAELLVSELATNAIRYGQGEDFRIDVEVGPAGVRVAVHDHNPVVPLPRHALPAEEGGRGMQLVHGLASAWGSQSDDAGKVVWFRMDATA